jgi:hypothetical protein
VTRAQCTAEQHIQPCVCLLPQMVFLVARQPALLELPPEEFKYSCQDLGGALNLPPAAAAYLISRLQPSCLKQVGAVTTWHQDRSRGRRSSSTQPCRPCCFRHLPT